MLLVQQCLFPCFLCSSISLTSQLTKFIVLLVARCNSPGFQIIPGKELTEASALVYIHCKACGAKVCLS